MSINRITATAILVLVLFITNVHAQTPTLSQPRPRLISYRAGNISGTNIITAINDPATTGVINDNRISASVISSMRFS